MLCFLTCSPVAFRKLFVRTNPALSVVLQICNQGFRDVEKFSELENQRDRAHRLFCNCMHEELSNRKPREDDGI